MAKLAISPRAVSTRSKTAWSAMPRLVLALGVLGGGGQMAHAAQNDYGATVGAVPTPDIMTTAAPVMAAPSLVSAPVSMAPQPSAMESGSGSDGAPAQAGALSATAMTPTAAPPTIAPARTYAANGPIYTPYTNAAPAMQNALMTPSGPVAQQDFAQIRQAAQSYLAQQTQGLPGQVTISVADMAPRGLAQCDALEPFVPPGVRLWGRAMLGVRCNSERPWTIYLQVRIGVIGDYYVSTRAINAGETIGPQDMMPRHGDLTAMPASIITSQNQAIGATAANFIGAGFPLRSDLLRSALAIRLGQEVRIIARGEGFAVSSEGSALSNASVGQPVRVRTSNGVVVSGTVQQDDTVEVPL